MGRKMKIRIDLICIVLLCLNGFFDLKYVINLSTSDKTHLYPLYLYEILAIIIFLKLIYNYSISIKTNKLAKELFITMIFFSIYYIILFLIRVFTKNNYSSSQMLFRLIFSTGIFAIYIVLNPNKLNVFKKCMQIFLTVLNTGYLIASIKERYLAPNFPDGSSTYMAVAVTSIPLFFLFLRKDKKNQKLFTLDFLNLGIMCIFGCFSGSRAVFLIWCVEFLILILIILRNKLRSIGVGFIIIVFGLITLYTIDFNFCQASINRVLNFDSYKINPEQDVSKDILDDYRAETGDKYTNQTRNKDVNFHNPTLVSNTARAILLTEALELLEDDWVFSLKGNTELIVILDGEKVVSGAHNFVLDYMLAFGAVGIIIIAIFFLFIFFNTIKELLKNQSKTNLIVYLLMIFAMVGMGLTQAVCSMKLSLIMFGISIAFIYINERNENHETSIVKKGNYLYG